MRVSGQPSPPKNSTSLVSCLLRHPSVDESKKLNKWKVQLLFSNDWWIILKNKVNISIYLILNKWEWLSTYLFIIWVTGK
jgi:hypothetical protein